jgi:putative two-component system response regulator
MHHQSTPTYEQPDADHTPPLPGGAAARVPVAELDGPESSAEAPAAEPLAEPLAEASPTSDRFAEARILIVEDEEMNVRLLERILGNAGYVDIRSTTDPFLVPDLYSLFRPDLVLLDLRMPGRDGYGVLEDLATVAAGERFLPVLALTGDASAGAKVRALALGAKDFLAKPFDVEEVLLRIRNLLETRWLYRELEEQNAALERRVIERTRALQETEIEVLERLAAAAEFRDDDTGQHTQRVGDLAARLGAAIGLPEEEVDLLRRAAPLHDVGKIGIPDRVLLKPGKLTPQEFEVMKTHTLVGARLLAGGRSALVRMAERIARSHHERWDGQGYPDGLAGGRSRSRRASCRSWTSSTRSRTRGRTARRGPSRRCSR